jgi:hypothetical protein
VVRSLAFLALALALGSLVVGHGVLLPALARNELIDANLLRSLAEPLAIILADIILASSALLAMLTPRWLGARAGGIVAALLVAAAALDRGLVLPTLYRALARVDLLSGRPIHRALDAETWGLRHLVLVGVMLAAASWIGLVWALGCSRSSGARLPAADPVRAAARASGRPHGIAAGSG